VIVKKIIIINIVKVKNIIINKFNIIINKFNIIIMIILFNIFKEMSFSNGKLVNINGII